MQDVTQQFKDAVYAPARTITARVTFDISDVSAYDDITGVSTTNTQTVLSDISQITDKTREFNFNLATFEPGRWRLDGTFSIASENKADNREVGFISGDLCGADGVYSVPQKITCTFGSPHSSAGITVTFDTKNNEYATDFSVVAYNGATVVETVNVTGNTDAMALIDGQFANYNKIEVTVTKWSVGFRRARLAEIDFGIVLVYTDDNLISARLSEEMMLTTDQIPSPELEFSVMNLDREFNILNPTGYYKYLQQRQGILAELGLEILPNVIEWVPIGNFLLWEWTSEEGSLVATFTGRTNIDLMADYSYEQLTPLSTNLGALARTVFAACGIKNYYVDPALDSIQTLSVSEKTDCKTIIQMIAIAGRCNLYVTRDNTINLRQLSFGAPVDEMSFDNIYSEPKIELDRIVQRAEVTWYSNLDTPTVVGVDVPGVPLGDTIKLDGNTLVSSATVATAVANWLIAQRGYRAKYTVNWRGNPAQELADIVSIENTYGANMNARVTKTELDYQGYLSVTTEARGAAN